MEISKNSL